MKTLNENEIIDFKNHLNLTTDYVLKNTEVELDVKSIDDCLRQVWEISVEDYELDDIEWGSEKEELYGQVFDEMECELFNKIKWSLYRLNYE